MDFHEIAKAEVDAALEDMATRLARCHYGCDGGCPYVHLPPLTRWQKVTGWFRRRWWSAWARMHELMPGECDNDE